MAVRNPSVIPEVAVPPANKYWHNSTKPFKLPGYEHAFTNLFTTAHLFRAVSTVCAGEEVAVPHSSSFLLTLLLQACF